MLRRALPLIVIAPIAALAFAGGTVSAHLNQSYADCSGVHARAVLYDATETNSVVVFLDGAVVGENPNFGTTYTADFGVPQDGLPHSWQVSVDAPGEVYDLTESGSVGPCGEQQQTTTTEVATSTTSTVPDTTTVVTTTPTTVPATTTTPEPGTSSSVATTSTSSLPGSPTTTSTLATSSTVPVDSSSTTVVPTTVPSSPPPSTIPPPSDTNPVCTPVTQPDGTNSCQTGTLPPTGSSTGVVVLVAICLLAVGSFAVHTGRRP